MARLEKRFDDFSETIQSIDKTMTEIQTLMKANGETLTATLATLQKDIQRHGEIFHGVGATPGIIMKVDRLEIADKKREYWIKTLTGAVATLLTKFVYDLFHR